MFPQYSSQSRWQNFLFNLKQWKLVETSETAWMFYDGKITSEREQYTIFIKNFFKMIYFLAVVATLI